MRQYDVHNEHVIKRTEFLRGLDQLRCNLSCTEMGTIMDIFQSPLRYTIYITYVHLIHIYIDMYIYIFCIISDYKYFNLYVFKILIIVSNKIDLIFQVFTIFDQTRLKYRLTIFNILFFFAGQIM